MDSYSRHRPNYQKQNITKSEYLYRQNESPIGTPPSSSSGNFKPASPKVYQRQSTLELSSPKEWIVDV